MQAQELIRNQMTFGLAMASAQGSWGAVKNLIALQLQDLVIKQAYTGYQLATQRCRRQRDTQVRSQIDCERTFAAPQNNRPPEKTKQSDRMDAVIDQVTTLPSMKSLLSIAKHDYLPHEFESVCLAPDVWFELKSLRHNEGQLEAISFRLFSYENEVQHLQKFIDTCNVDQARRISNELGSHLYQFDQVVRSKANKTQNPLPVNHLVYTKSKFHTTRSFDNVFFDQRDAVQKRVRFFLNERSWYEKKGIPQTMGFLFHGDPGCGKTSATKAIANVGRRHIINVQLSEIKTKAQLHHLFFNEEIHVQEGAGNPKVYTIPIHERLQVIEDIDAMGDLVLRREWKKPEVPGKPMSEEDAWAQRMREQEDPKDVIDLSFLLNLLDGTLESSGRVIVLSSNFPERIDRALIRPGRIDMIVKFEKCSRDILQQLVSSFYEQSFEEHAIWREESVDGKWSPAEANQILFRNFEAPEQALDELMTLQPRDLQGFKMESNSSLIE